MQLYRIQTTKLHHLTDSGRRLIDKQPDSRDHGRQFGDDPSGLVRVNETRAARIEDEPERIGTAGRRVTSIFDIGNAADFHPRHSVIRHQSTNFR